MPKTRRIRLSTDFSAIPIVCIFGLNNYLCDLIRDYFDSRNCKTYINTDTGLPPSYTFIFGNHACVNRILAERKNKLKGKIFLLIWGEINQHINFLPKKDIYIIYLDSYLINKSIFQTIMSSCIASNKRLFDLRKNQEQHKKLFINKNKQSSVGNSIFPFHWPHFEADQVRINSLINKLYQNKVKNIHNVFHLKIKFSRWVKIITAVQVFLIPVYWFLIISTIGMISIILGVFSLEKGNLTKAESYINLSKRAIYHQSSVIDATSTILEYMHLDKYLSFPRRISSLLDVLTKTEESALNTFYKVQSLMLPTSINDQNNLHSFMRRSDILALKNNLEQFEIYLGLVKTEYDPLLKETGLVPSLAAKIIPLSIYVDKLDKIKSHLPFIKSALLLLSEISGSPSTKRYLLVFQNSAELRPTGGFIGSVGMVTMQDGELVDFEIQDVYAIDGQLKGHIEPPVAIRSVLGEVHWYLRDSNWDPDFPTSARRIAWFYEKETGVVVDGVIGISSTLVERLLEAVGPVVLPDSKDIIDKENFYIKSYFYTQHNFFPGSTQKKDFLTSLSAALKTKILTVDPGTIEKLLTVGEKAFNGSDVQMYFIQKELQDLALQLGWAGQILPGSSQKSCMTNSGVVCLPDYFGFVEANLGVNKESIAVDREVVYSLEMINIGEFKREAKILMIHKNNILTHEKTKESYRTYLRILYPSKANILNVLINQMPVPSFSFHSDKKKSPLPFQLNEQYNESLKSQSVALDIKEDSVSQVAITSSYTFGITQKQPFDYELFIKKQPGIIELPLRLQIKVPNNWQISSSASWDQIPPVFLENSKQFEYNTRVSHDELVQIRFRPILGK